jgi:hypothetical protein
LRLTLFPDTLCSLSQAPTRLLARHAQAAEVLGEE